MKIRIVRKGFNDQILDFITDEVGFNWSKTIKNWDEKHFTELDSAHNMSFFNVPEIPVGSDED